MGGFDPWPFPSFGSGAEIFDRVRLLNDLEEATDPTAAPSVLLIVGLPRNVSDDSPETASVLERVEAKFVNAAAARASIYRTRTSEICLLIDGTPRSAETLLDQVRRAVDSTPQRADRRLFLAMTALPDEATESLAALRLVDQRLTADANAAATIVRPERSRRAPLRLRRAKPDHARSA